MFLGFRLSSAQLNLMELAFANELSDVGLNASKYIRRPGVAEIDQIHFSQKINRSFNRDDESVSDC